MTREELVEAMARAIFDNGRRERIWLSPECHIAQPDLFGGAA